MSDLLIKMIVTSDRVRRNISDNDILNALMRLSKGDFGLYVSIEQKELMELGVTNDVTYKGIYKDNNGERYVAEYTNKTATIYYEKEV